MKLFSAWKDFILLTAKQKNISSAYSLLERMKKSFVSRPDAAEFQGSVSDLETDLKKVEQNYNEYIKQKEEFNPEQEILARQIGILYERRQFAQQISALQRLISDFELSDEKKIDYLEDLYYAYDYVGNFTEARNIVLQLQTNYPTHTTTLELIENAKGLPY